MSRFVIASRTRQDIDLSHYFGEYKFSVVPRALFTTDGSLHPTTDKSVIAKELRNICHIDTNDMIIEGHQEYKAIVFDGMAVVHRINIKKAKIKNCRDFATTFTDIIFSESDGFDEIRIIFDRYDKKSLKSQTRSKRTHGVLVQYRVRDE